MPTVRVLDTADPEDVRNQRIRPPVHNILQVAMVIRCVRTAGKSRKRMRHGELVRHEAAQAILCLVVLVVGEGGSSHDPHSCLPGGNRTLLTAS